MSKRIHPHAHNLLWLLFSESIIVHVLISVTFFAETDELGTVKPPRM